MEMSQKRSENYDANVANFIQGWNSSVEIEAIIVKQHLIAILDLHLFN